MHKNMQHDNMQDKDMKNVLSGKDNKRLGNTTPTHKESTAAWSSTDKLTKPSNVSTPSQADIVNAKEWVDNGSRL